MPGSKNVKPTLEKATHSHHVNRKLRANIITIACRNRATSTKENLSWMTQDTPKNLGIFSSNPINEIHKVGFPFDS